MRKTTALKNNPFLYDQETLEFDSPEKTRTQKIESFITRWLENTNPYEEYSSFFLNNKRTLDFYVAFVKNFYGKYVIDKNWTEQKYVMTLDYIFVNKFNFSDAIFDKAEKLYNQGRLPIQLAMKKRRRRNRG